MADRFAQGQQGEGSERPLPGAPPQGPVPCHGGCGFFGRPDTLNLCSKCFKDRVSKQQAGAAVAVEVNPNVASARSSVGEVSLVNSGAEITRTIVDVVEMRPAAGEKRSMSPPKRCGSCRKRVGLTGFKCRCGDVFCGIHRYSDRHDCSVDYKQMGREEIARANPVVKGSKVAKI